MIPTGKGSSCWATHQLLKVCCHRWRCRWQFLVRQGRRDNLADIIWLAAIIVGVGWWDFLMVKDFLNPTNPPASRLGSSWCWPDEGEVCVGIDHQNVFIFDIPMDHTTLLCWKKKERWNRKISLWNWEFLWSVSGTVEPRIWKLRNLTTMKKTAPVLPKVRTGGHNK